MASVRAQVLCYLMRKPGVENLKGVAMFGGDLALSQINAPSVSRNEPHPLIDLNVKVRVLVVDDHPLLRAGVAAVLDGKSDLKIVGEASGREAIERFQALQPDVTVMDLQMPGMSGIDAMRAIRLKSPTARIVVLTTFSGDVLAQRALKAGASAYVLKERVRAELADIIRAVHRACDLTLTSREVEVLQRVAAGNSNKLIAKALTISEETAKTYVKSIVEKLGAHNRTHAVTIGLHRGIIELS
jgi:DNA-binding NarL/FixJ family response regulator